MEHCLGINHDCQQTAPSRWRRRHSLQLEVRATLEQSILVLWAMSPAKPHNYVEDSNKPWPAIRRGFGSRRKSYAVRKSYLVAPGSLRGADHDLQCQASCHRFTGEKIS